MLRHLFRRREIWWPTKWGLLILAAVLLGPVFLWWFLGEGFLSRTARVPADVLAVESWIGREGVHAAKAEFERGGYRFVILTGAPIENRLSGQYWDYAQYMHRELLQLGLDPQQVILATTPRSPSQRTFASAESVRIVLEEQGIRPKGINVLTIGAHARRSRLVFARTIPGSGPVGVISLRPSTYAKGPWWQSSERAEDLLKESVGYFYELIFHSGRLFGRPSEVPPKDGEGK
jgi:hypothetical protein